MLLLSEGHFCHVTAVHGRGMTEIAPSQLVFRAIVFSVLSFINWLFLFLFFFFFLPGNQQLVCVSHIYRFIALAPSQLISVCQHNTHLFEAHKKQFILNMCSLPDIQGYISIKDNVISKLCAYMYTSFPCCNDSSS